MLFSSWALLLNCFSRRSPSSAILREGGREGGRGREGREGVWREGGWREGGREGEGGKGGREGGRERGRGREGGREGEKEGERGRERMQNINTTYCSMVDFYMGMFLMLADVNFHTFIEFNFSQWHTKTENYSTLEIFQTIPMFGI